MTSGLIRHTDYRLRPFSICQASPFTRAKFAFFWWSFIVCMCAWMLACLPFLLGHWLSFQWSVFLQSNWWLIKWRQGGWIGRKCVSANVLSLNWPSACSFIWLLGWWYSMDCLPAQLNCFCKPSFRPISNCSPFFMITDCIREAVNWQVPNVTWSFLTLPHSVLYPFSVFTYNFAF